MVKKITANIYLLLVIAFMYMPIALIVVYSFSGQARFSFSRGFSFDSYAALFKSPELLGALKSTMIIAVVSSVVATVLGTVSAIGIFYLGKCTKKFVSSINQLPMINSEIVMAVSLMVFFTTFGFPQGYLRLILGHISFCTPYVVLSVMPRLMQMDSNIYEAALDLGATPSRAMWSVMVPMLVPGIVSGFVMSFTMSIDDFIITQFNKGQTGIQTLSTLVFTDARVGGLEPYWFPVFSIIFVTILAALLIVNMKKTAKSRNAAKSRGNA